MTQTSRAVRIHAHGGPEQLVVDTVEVGDPGPGEVCIRHHAIGLNFIDVYQRTGLYPNPMPLALGMEGAGVIEAVGEGVTHLKVGDRAAYASNPPGSYSEVRVMPARTVVRLPDAIDFETGAAMMLKGLTVQYLLKKTLPAGGLRKGDFVLFHAGMEMPEHLLDTSQQVQLDPALPHFHQCDFDRTAAEQDRLGL